jgi:hypothetical protein
MADAVEKVAALFFQIAGEKIRPLRTAYKALANAGFTP